MFKLLTKIPNDFGQRIESLQSHLMAPFNLTLNFPKGEKGKGNSISYQGITKANLHKMYFE